MEYATALFEQGTLERYLAYYQRLLRAMVEDDSRPVDQLELLGPHERHQVLYDWNVTEAAYPQDRCIHELFEAQVEKNPDAVAVMWVTPDLDRETPEWLRQACAPFGRGQLLALARSVGWLLMYVELPWALDRTLDLADQLYTGLGAI